MSKHRRIPIICLALVAMLYRALVPAGFMPATSQAARHGTLLVICHHGELAYADQDGQGSANPSFEQCPFGAAAGPALASVPPALSLPIAAISPRADWTSAFDPRVPPHLHPPARGPPLLS